MDQFVARDLNKVVSTIKSARSYEKLLTSWESFSRQLDIKVDDIVRIKTGLNSTNIYDNLVHDLLVCWRAKEGENANLTTLCSILTRCKFCEISDNLSKLLNPEIEESTQQQPNKNLDATTNILSYDSRIPHIPSYYIPRCIRSRQKLNPAIFKTDIKDIFVFAGCERNEVSKVAGTNPTDVSIHQIEEVKVRFILLLEDNHFDRLCQVASAPVHLIHYKCKACHWVKSSRNFNLIQSYINEEQEAVIEDLFLDQLLNFQPIPVCLTDTPGMGKTLLLASIAQKLMNWNTNRFVVFLTLHEIVPQLPRNLNGIMRFIRKTVLCHNDTTRIKLNDSFNPPLFEIFLDGFDEVHVTQKHIAENLFRKLKSMRNVRIYVSTRPHLKNELEKVLKVLGHNILPFVEDNIILFLTSYWVSEYQAPDNDNLVEFAHKCLKNIRTKLTSEEKEFAGIPLQCALVADIHGEEARTYSKNNFFDINIASIFDIFQKGIQIKLEKAAKIINKKAESISTLQILLSKLKSIFGFNGDERYVLKCVIKYHVYEAMKLVFPEWLKRNPKCLAIMEEVGMHYLCAPGILEQMSANKPPSFVHRTFAEYLIAEHLVREMQTCEDCVSMLFDTVVSDCDKITLPPYLSHNMQGSLHEGYKFNHYVICYFIDLQIQRMKIKYDREILARCKIYFSECILHSVSACVDDSMANIFKYLWERACTDFDSEGIYNLIIQAVLMCEKVEMLDKIIEQLKLKTGSQDIGEMSKQMKMHFNISENILEIALRRGNYAIAEYLLNNTCYNYNIFKHLPFNCCRDSCFNEKEVVQSKIQIIKMLAQIYNENDDDFHPASLYASNIHVDLLLCLIEQGAYVNANIRNFHGKTFLHHLSYSDYHVNASSYKRLFELLVAKKYRYFDAKDLIGESFIFKFVRNVNDIDTDILKLLQMEGFDFNSANINGQYLLLNALRCKTSISLLRKLLSAGCKPFCTKEGYNVLHEAVLESNVDLIKEIVDQISKFKICDINDIIVSGKTAFDLCNETTQKYTSLWIKEILVKNGAMSGADERMIQSQIDEHLQKTLSESFGDLTLYDEYGNSVLYYVIKEDTRVSLIDKLLNLGSPLICSKTGTNSLHKAINVRHYDLIKYFVENKICDVNDFDLTGRTAYNLCKTIGWNDKKMASINEILDDSGVKIDSQTLEQSEVDTRTMKTLLRSFGDFNSFDEYGRRILYYLILAEARVSLVDTILKSGANPVCTIKGTNILHLAVSKRNMEITKYLVKRRICALDDVDEFGRTLLDICAIKEADNFLIKYVHDKNDCNVMKKFISVLLNLDFDSDGDDREQNIFMGKKRRCEEELGF